MIDWGIVLENSIWLAGLALVLAAFSLASYRAASLGWSLSFLWASFSANLWTLVGALFFCQGMSFTSGSALETALWILLSAACMVAWALQFRSRPIEGIKSQMHAHDHARNRDKVQAANTLQHVCEWVIRFELAWLLLLSPFFLFPGTGGPGVLVAAAIPVLWIARRIAREHFVPSTPLNWPICVMLVMVLVSLFATFDPALSLGKVLGVLFGVGVFYAITGLISSIQGLRWALLGYSAAGLLLALVGFVGTDWASKFNFLESLESKLPSFLRGLPGAENGFNPNEIAGALLWVVPLQISLVRAIWSPHFSTGKYSGVIKVGIAAAAAISAGLLLLTESRGALAGLALGAVLLAAALVPRTKLTVIAGSALAVVVIAAALYIGPGNIAGRVFGSVGTGFGSGDTFRSAQSRTEIWSRALYGIEDFPITGMGMNTFRKLMPDLYPSSFPPDEDLGHAHNTLLQVALDLGLPGMVAYTALWIICASILVKIWMQSNIDWIRWTAAGIAAGLSAYAVFSLTDTVALGAKPGVFFWALIALLMVTWRLSLVSKPPTENTVHADNKPPSPDSNS